ncbi:MAG: hypothetical protein ACRCUY_03310 [Thermoguttaceae bacterium]
MKSQHSFFDTENHLAKIDEINGFLLEPSIRSLWSLLSGFYFVNFSKIENLLSDWSRYAPSEFLEMPTSKRSLF